MNPPCCWKRRSKNLAFARISISCRGKTILTCMRMACVSRLQKKWKTWRGRQEPKRSGQNHTRTVSIAVARKRVPLGSQSLVWGLPPPPPQVTSAQSAQKVRFTRIFIGESSALVGGLADKAFGKVQLRSPRSHSNGQLSNRPSLRRLECRN